MLLVLHEACILMVNRSPVALLVNTFVVFIIGQVLKRLVPHGEMPGASFTRDIKIECTSKFVRFFGRLKAIIGGK